MGGILRGYNYGMLVRANLSVSLAGLERGPGLPWSGGPRAAIEWAAAAGFRSVQLDAAAPGLRPRELDRSGRRDVASLLRRLGLTPSGLDLWAPPEHFADPARAERATGALLAALNWSADLATLAGGGGRVVAVTVPASIPGALLALMEERAAARDARVADHSWPARGSTTPQVGVGIDPAQLLLSGANPAAEVSRLGKRLVQARLSDASREGRVAIGARGGRLDLLAYAVAVQTAGAAGSIVVDLRGLHDQEAGARAALAAVA